MSPLTALACVLLLLAITTYAGLAWQRRRGRLLDTPASDYVDDKALGIELGESVTLLQFSTRLCAQCKPTHTKLSRLTSEHPGVKHHDVDLSENFATAQRYKIMQTPTVLVLDPRGRVIRRIGGPPQLAELSAFLADVTRHPSLGVPREERAHAA